MSVGVATVARKEPVPVTATNSTAAPKPATATVESPACRTSISTSSVLMPKAIRCAASPVSVARTLGMAAAVRTPYQRPLATV